MTEALDNLGRKINSTNMSIGELRGLIGTLMKSKVGPAKPISSFKDAEEKEEKEFDYKPLLEAFEKYVKGHQEEIREQTSLIEDLRSLISEKEQLKQIKEAKKEDSESPEEKKESFTEKAIKGLKSIFKKDAKQGEVVSESTEGLYKVFSKKGSGYTHDIYCEKWLQSIHEVLTQMAEKLGVSNLTKTNSILENIRKESFFEEAKKSIADGPAVKSKDTASPYMPTKARDDFMEEIESAKQFFYDAEPFTLEVDSVRDAYDLMESLFTGKLFSGKLSTRQEQAWAGSWATRINEVEEYLRDKFKDKSLTEILESDGQSRNTYNKLKNEGKIIDGLHTEAQIIEHIIKKQAQSMQHEGRVQRRNDVAQKKNLDIQIQVLDKLQKIILGFEVIEKVLGGVIEKERQFTQDIRAAAYETAGITKESESLQRVLENIGKTSLRTGVSRDKFQESFIRGLKSGVKDQKKLNSLVTAQLNTEKQIGIEAGTLGDQFIEYSTSLKLNEQQIAAVGRGIRDVGRNSGVVGDKLREAVSSSKQFVDQMKKAGTLTAASISNITGLQAEFQKLGVDSQKVMSALSSTTGFFEADNQTITLIAQAAGAVGLVHQAQAGVILQNKEMMKGMAIGFKDVANRMGLAGESLTDLRKSLSTLSDYEKMTLNLRMKAAYGVEANEFLSLIEGFENSSKTLSDKLRELNKEKMKNLTLEEREKVLLDERNTKLSASLGVLTGLSESAKDASTMSEALSRFSVRRRDFEEDINALGYAWTSEIDVARSSLKTSISTLNEGLKKAGKRELSIGTSEIEKALKDQTAFRDLVSQIEKGEQELATAQKAQADPLTRMDQTLMEINDTLRNISQSLISGLFNSLIGKAIIAITGATAAILAFYSKSQNMFLDTGRFLGTFLPQVTLGGTRDTTADQRNQPLSFIQKIVQSAKDKIFGPQIIPAPEMIEPIEAKIESKENKEVVVKAAKSEGVSAAESSARGCCDRLIEINKSMLEVLNKIASCVCDSVRSTQQDLSVKTMDEARKEGMTPVSAVEKASSQATSRASLTPEERATRKAKAQEIKNIRNDKKLNDIEKRIRLQEVRSGKIQTPKESGIDIKSLISSGSQMAKSAAGILVLAAGVVALAAAIVFLSDKILGAFNLDFNKITQTAAAVGALAVAGAGIAAAGYLAYKELTENQDSNEFPKISKLFSTKIASQVAGLLLVGPALVLLGAAIVKMSQMVVDAFGLDMTTVAQTAGTVAAIVGAAGALTLAASEALEGFEKLSENEILKRPGNIRKLIWDATKSILLIGPGLVLLGAAIVKFSQIVLGVLGLDAATIGQVTGKVVALIAGAGAIAGAITGALFGLYGLGLLKETYDKVKDTVWKGAAAMMLLTPLIVILASALNRIVGGILGVMGVDAGKAARVAFDVAALIGSTALISGAIIGAIAGLGALGLLAGAVTGPQILAILGGAAALMLLTPPIIILASALTNMVKGILATRDIDASTAANTAYQVAGVIGAAGAIALSVLAAMAGLSGLGVLAWTYAAWIPPMIGGAAALYALTPVILSLASSIIQMAGSVAGTLVSQEEIKKATEGVSSILGAAAQISLSVLASVAGLSILGAFFTGAMLAIPLMWLGTKAFSALINPIVSFIGAVKEASNKIGSAINPSEAESMSKGIATILGSVGDITKNVASASTSLASMPVYGGFWNWLIGSKISDRMWDGVRALKSLMSPIIGYVSAVKLFSGVVGRIVDPKEAKPMGEGVSAILKSCADVTESIFKAAEPLKGMSKYQGFFNWLRGRTVGDMVDSGVEALNNLSGPITRYVGAIKSFSSKVGGNLSPRSAAEMAVGIEDILCAVGSVSKTILDNKESLSSVKYKEWGWFGTNYVNQMNAGVTALEKMSDPVVSYVSVIKKFSKKLGKRLSPRMAASMASGVAEIISATGEVTKSVLETKEELSKIKTTTGWGWFKKDYVKKSKEGVAALKQLSSPIITYVDAIKNFSSEVGRKLDVRQAASMARGVSEILSASGEVTEKIVATKDKLMTIKSSEGFWLWATDIPASMNKGVKALGELKQPIIDYISSIISFSKEIGSKVKPADSKSAAKSLAQVSGVVDLFSCVLNELQSKINPLTKSGWFVDSPIAQMTNAKSEMDKFFPVLVGFVESIVKNVNKAFANVGDLKSTVKNLGFIAQIFQSVGETTSTVREKIIPLTTAGWFRSSDVESIKNAIPLFNGFFDQISNFINEGLVKPISKIEDGSTLRESAKKIPMIAQLLSETTNSISALQSMMDLTTNGFFSSSPMKKINDNKGKFAEYFAGISAFLNSGIVDPIKKITGLEGLIEAKDKLKDVGCFIYGAKLTLESLSGIFSLMESDSIFKKSPLENIKINKDELANYINMAKDFIVSGLMTPAMSLPEGAIGVATTRLKYTADMISQVPVVIKNLASAVSLATDKDDFFGETPMKKIADSRVVFGSWFKEIANFVKEGIAVPVTKELAGVDLGLASKTMTSMASVVSSITPIIKNLIGIMGMMSGEAGEKMDEDFPIDKILLYKNTFADHFKKISIFLRDGIIAPVKEIFPETKGLRETSQILSSMNNIVGLVPKLILGMSKGFVPLVDSGRNLSQEVPMQQIMDSKEKFAAWFVQIAEFLKQGVIEPINKIIGDPKDIQKAGRTLSSMNSVVGSLTSIIKNLAQMFGGLNDRNCLQKAPAEIIAEQTSKFSGWFQNVIGFLKLGIIDPINNLVPNEKEISSARAKLGALSSSMSQIPEMFDELGGSISMFSKGFLWRIINGFKISKLSKNFISMANIINEGIVKPIQKFLPSSDELSEVNDQLTEFIMIIEKVAGTMGMAGRAFLGIKPIDLEGVVSMKEGIQKVSDPSVFEAEVQKAIRGRSEMAINMAEKQAEAAAIAALSKKTGRTSLSGVEVDTQVDMEKRVVKAVARWSKENHDAALDVKKSMEETNAGAGGLGRGSMMQEASSAAMQKIEPAQAASKAGIKSLGEKGKPLTTVAKVDIDFMDSSQDVREAMQDAALEAKAMLAKKLGVKEILGSQVKVEYSIDREAEQAIATAQYTPENKFSNVVKDANRRAAGDTQTRVLTAPTGAAMKQTLAQEPAQSAATATKTSPVVKQAVRQEPAQSAVQNTQLGSMMDDQNASVIRTLRESATKLSDPKFRSDVSESEVELEKFETNLMGAIKQGVVKAPKDILLDMDSEDLLGWFNEYQKTIPKFAEGGVVNKATLGVIGEAGPEAVVPLSGIEKYSSGIIKGLERINSTLIKVLASLKSNKKGGSNSIVVEQSTADNIISPTLEIGKEALSFSIGLALAPTVRGLPGIFKDNAVYMSGIFKESISNLTSLISQKSSSTFDYIGSVAENAFSLTEPYMEQISGYAQNAFAPIGNYISRSFEPLTKGFTRSMEAGEGIFKSLSRGITSQYMSLTEGVPISEIISNYFSQVKDGGVRAFEFIKSKVPQSLRENATKALLSVKDSGLKAFNYISSTIPQSIKDNAVKAFGAIKSAGSNALYNVGNYLSNSFAPLAKGFTRSMESGAGVFKSLSRGITSQYMSITKGKPISEIANGVFSKVKDSGYKAFSYISSNIPQSVKDNVTKAFGTIKNVGSKTLSNVGGYLASSFAPLTKGFTRSMESGASVFQSVSRGVTSQYMSITKGKPISEIAKGAFDQVKESGSKAFTYLNSSIPQSIKDNATKAFSSISGYASKAFSSMSGFFSSSFAPLTKGFTRSMEAGEGIFKSLSRGMTSQFMSLTKGKPISEIASGAFSSVKEYGKKGFSLAGNALKGLGERTKGGLRTATGAVGSFLSGKSRGDATAGAPKAISPVENIKKVGEAGSSVKGSFEGVKEALKNLAEGLKSLANKESFLGALNLIPTGVGLTAMVPGFLGAKLVEKIDGKKASESLEGLSQGLKSMASGKVLLGSGAVLLASIGLLGLIPALPGLAILGAISGLVTSGLTALSKGLTTFGTAAANPMFWLGILGIGALGAALIPLGYALSTLSPLITAFGSAVGVVLGGISGIITSVAEGMTSFLGAVSIEKAAGLMGIAAGLGVLSLAIVAFSAATAAAGWISFFGGNSTTLDNIVRLADAGPNLNLFAEGLSVITTELKNFESSLANIESIEKGLNRLIEVAIKVGSFAPMLQSMSVALKPLEPQKEVSLVSSVEQSAIQSTQTTGMTPTNFKSQFTDDWSEKYHSTPITEKVQRNINSNKEVKALTDKFDTPGMIKHVDEIVGGKNLSYGAIKESYLGKINSTQGLDSTVPGQVGSVGGKPTTAVPVSVSTASPSTASKANIEQKLMKDKASLAPAKSEVVSPELNALTTETEEQTEILNQMKDLFEQFLEVLKPKSQPNSSTGGEPGSTIPETVVGKPTNYYRRVAGNIAQTPGRATLNLGAKAVS